MVGRKKALRTLPVFLALNVACTNGISTDTTAVLSAATPGTRDAAALGERLVDMSNPRRTTLLQKNGAVGDRSLLRVRGGVSRAGAKDKKGLGLPGSPIERALAVNGVSWAAVVGGVLWSRTKMGPEGGEQHTERKRGSPHYMVATRGQGESIMHTTAIVDFSMRPLAPRLWTGVRSCYVQPYDPMLQGPARHACWLNVLLARFRLLLSSVLVFVLVSYRDLLKRCWLLCGFLNTAGIVRKALLGAVVSSASVQVASNVLQAVSGSGEGPHGHGYGASALVSLRLG